jgi:hypothetical protein
MCHEWPDFWPANCPPEDAEPPDCEVYHYVRRNPPGKGDCKPRRGPNSQRCFDDECMACGLSVYPTREAALECRDAVPGFRRLYVAKATLEPHHGVMKMTPSAASSMHHTWWVAIGIDPRRLFTIVQGPQVTN